jgi:hypothetical protein
MELVVLKDAEADVALNTPAGSAALTTFAAVAPSLSIGRTGTGAVVTLLTLFCTVVGNTPVSAAMLFRFGSEAPAGSAVRFPVEAASLRVPTVVAVCFVEVESICFFSGISAFTAEEAVLRCEWESI